MPLDATGGDGVVEEGPGRMNVGGIGPALVARVIGSRLARWECCHTRRFFRSA